MACRQNRVIDHLTQVYTDTLHGYFSALSKATRKLTPDPSGVMPEATPLVIVLEEGVQLSQAAGEEQTNYFVQAEVEATLLVNVHATAQNTGIPQQFLAETLAVLWTVLDVGHGVDGVPYTVIPNGRCNTYPGTTGDGQIEMPIKVRFWRGLKGEAL